MSEYIYSPLYSAGSPTVQLIGIQWPVGRKSLVLFTILLGHQAPQYGVGRTQHWRASSDKLGWTHQPPMLSCDSLPAFQCCFKDPKSQRREIHTKMQTHLWPEISVVTANIGPVFLQEIWATFRFHDIWVWKKKKLCWLLHRNPLPCPVGKTNHAIAVKCCIYFDFPTNFWNFYIFSTDHLQSNVAELLCELMRSE